MPPLLRLTLPFIKSCARLRSTPGRSGGNIAKHQLPNSLGRATTGAAGALGVSALDAGVAVGVGVGVGVAVGVTLADGDGEAVAEGDGEAVAEDDAEAVAEAVAEGLGSTAPAPGAASNRAAPVTATRVAVPADRTPALRHTRPTSNIALCIKPSSPEPGPAGYTGV